MLRRKVFALLALLTLLLLALLSPHPFQTRNYRHSYQIRFRYTPHELAFIDEHLLAPLENHLIHYPRLSHLQSVLTSTELSLFFILSGMPDRQESDYTQIRNFILRFSADFPPDFSKPILSKSYQAQNPDFVFVSTQPIDWVYSLKSLAEAVRSGEKQTETRLSFFPRPTLAAKADYLDAAHWIRSFHVNQKAGEVQAHGSRFPLYFYASPLSDTDSLSKSPVIPRFSTPVTISLEAAPAQSHILVQSDAAQMVSLKLKNNSHTASEKRFIQKKLKQMTGTFLLFDSKAEQDSFLLKKALFMLFLLALLLLFNAFFPVLHLNLPFLLVTSLLWFPLFFQTPPLNFIYLPLLSLLLLNLDPPVPTGAANSLLPAAPHPFPISLFRFFPLVAFLASLWIFPSPSESLHLFLALKLPFLTRALFSVPLPRPLSRLSSLKAQPASESPHSRCSSPAAQPASENPHSPALPFTVDLSPHRRPVKYLCLGGSLSASLLLLLLLPLALSFHRQSSFHTLHFYFKQGLTVNATLQNTQDLLPLIERLLPSNPRTPLIWEVKPGEATLFSSQAKVLNTLHRRFSQSRSVHTVLQTSMQRPRHYTITHPDPNALLQLPTLFRRCLSRHPDDRLLSSLLFTPSYRLTPLFHADNEPLFSLRNENELYRHTSNLVEKLMYRHRPHAIRLESRNANALSPSSLASSSFQSASEERQWIHYNTLPALQFSYFGNNPAFCKAIRQALSRSGPGYEFIPADSTRHLSASPDFFFWFAVTFTLLYILTLRICRSRLIPVKKAKILFFPLKADTVNYGFRQSDSYCPQHDGIYFCRRHSRIFSRLGRLSAGRRHRKTVQPPNPQSPSSY